MCCKNMTEEQKNRCKMALAYILLFLAPFTLGVSGIMAVALMSLISDKVSQTDNYQHPGYLTSTFLLYLMWMVVGSIIWFFVFPLALGVLLVATVWLLYRAVHGYSYMMINRAP